MDSSLRPPSRRRKNRVSEIDRAWLMAVVEATRSTLNLVTIDDDEFFTDQRTWTERILEDMASIEKDVRWIRQRIAAVGRESNMSLRELAEAADVSPSLIQKWTSLDPRNSFPPEDVLWHVGLAKTDPPDNDDKYKDEDIDPIDYLIRRAGIEPDAAEKVRSTLTNRQRKVSA